MKKIISILTIVMMLSLVIGLNSAYATRRNKPNYKWYVSSKYN